MVSDGFSLRAKANLQAAVSPALPNPGKELVLCAGGCR